MSGTTDEYRVSGHYGRYGTAEEPEGELQASYRRPTHEPVPADEDEAEGGIFRNSTADSSDSQEFDMSLVELLYSTSSFYAIVVPGKFVRKKER